MGIGVMTGMSNRFITGTVSEYSTPQQTLNSMLNPTAIATDAATGGLFGGIINPSAQMVSQYNNAQMLASQAANAARQIANSTDDVAKGASGAKYKTISTQSAESVNETFPKGFEPPYKLGTQTKIIELTDNTKLGEFVRVYDNVNSGQVGGWVMRSEDIVGLTPQQIQNKFALPTTPTHITDVTFKAGTSLRTGIANGLFGYEGGGIQFDMMGQRVGEFTNGRLLP